MKVTEKQLRRMISEMMLDMDNPSDVEPTEDAWAGGGENLVNPVDHAKLYKLVEASVRRSLRNLSEGTNSLTITDCQAISDEESEREDMYNVATTGTLDGRDFEIVVSYKLRGGKFSFEEVLLLTLDGDELISDDGNKYKYPANQMPGGGDINDIAESILNNPTYESRAQKCLADMEPSEKERWESRYGGGGEPEDYARYRQHGRRKREFDPYDV